METENPLCISLFLDFQKIWILNITIYKALVSINFVPLID